MRPFVIHLARNRSGYRHCTILLYPRKWNRLVRRCLLTLHHSVLYLSIDVDFCWITSQRSWLAHSGHKPQARPWLRYLDLCKLCHAVRLWLLFFVRVFPEGKSTLLMRLRRDTEGPVAKFHASRREEKHMVYKTQEHLLFINCHIV